MDSTKNKTMLLGLIVISLATLAQLYLSLTTLSAENIAKYSIGNILTLAALISAFTYVFTEYKKSSAVYFKFFVANYAISTLPCLVDSLFIAHYAAAVFALLTFVTLGVLLTIKDLGKKKSVRLSLAALAFDIAIPFTMHLSDAPQIDLSVTILVALSRLALPIILLIIISLKYSDKQLRGTK